VSYFAQVLLLQLKSFHEIISIAHIKYKEQKLPWFRTLNWYFLFCTNYYLFFEGFGHFFMETTRPEVCSDGRCCL
jgi:phosphatidate cytidylyltransferase